jgi:gluconokinase
MLLSIDIGTSGVRASLFDERGNEVPGAQVHSRRPISISNFGELYPNRLVNEVIDTIDQLPVITRIDHIAISAFWHSLIGVDSNGQPTTALLTWADTRAAQFANDLRSQFNEAEIHHRTGCRFHPSYWPAKLLWLKHQQTDKFNRTRYWLGFAEFFCLRLFGETATFVSTASATGLFNQRNCDWDWDFVDALGIARDTLPIIKTQTYARLTNEFALRWPALAEAELVTVVGDGAANNIGAGCSTKDKIALMIGTSQGHRTGSMIRITTAPRRHHLTMHRKPLHAHGALDNTTNPAYACQVVHRQTPLASPQTYRPSTRSYLSCCNRRRCYLRRRRLRR